MRLISRKLRKGDLLVSVLRIPLIFQCDECEKPLDEPALISPINGRVFCGHICAAKDYIRLKLGTAPHLVPNDIPLRLLPNNRS
jgi:hypothetical protein